MTGCVRDRINLFNLEEHIVPSTTSKSESSDGTSALYSSIQPDSVNTVAGLGFMSGVGSGKFDPDGTLTQEQFIAVMGRLARFLNFHADDYALELTEDDLAAYGALADWARTGASVLTDYDGNMLYAPLDAVDPHAPVTREQAAATLCNMLKTLNILS